MDSAVLLDRLLVTDVLRQAGTEEQLKMTESFRSAVEEERRNIEHSTELQQRLAEVSKDEEQEQLLTTIAEDDPEFVASYLVLADRLKGLSWPTRLQALVVLSQLETPHPPDEGVPDSFLPVHGERLHTLLRLGQPSIVYVWREDCLPCDTMQQELDEILDGHEGDIAQLAVYGPDAAELLYEEYDVVGAPTLLFVAHNQVVSRLQGAQYREAIEPEIALLREESRID